MAKSASEVVSKIVAKWKAFRRPSAFMKEWETNVEVIDGTGWDSHTNSEWDQTPKGKGDGTWDCHVALLPGEAKADIKLNDRDSGYHSLEDTLSDLSSDISSPPSPSSEEIAYLNLPFRQKHYLLTHIQRIIEAACLQHARTHLSASLSDPAWKSLHLKSTSREYQDDRLVGRDWLTEDEIELESWMQMLARHAKCDLPPQRKKRVFESVIGLRNAATHRNDRGDFGFEDLALAMQLPRALGDEARQADVDDAWRFAMADPTLDEETKERVREDMFGPGQYRTRCAVLSRIQTLLEESCFRAAAARIPAVLEKKGWTMPEQVELPFWFDVFRTYCCDPEDMKSDDSSHQSDDSTTTTTTTTTNIGASNGIRQLSQLLELLGGARIHIRIPVAHRLPLSDESLRKQVKRASAICELLGHPEQVLEIERVEEEFFESRGETATEGLCVLDRAKYIEL